MEREIKPSSDSYELVVGEIGDVRQKNKKHKYYKNKHNKNKNYKPKIDEKFVIEEQQLTLFDMLCRQSQYIDQLTANCRMLENKLNDLSENYRQFTEYIVKNIYGYQNNTMCQQDIFCCATDYEHFKTYNHTTNQRNFKCCNINCKTNKFELANINHKICFICVDCNGHDTFLMS